LDEGRRKKENPTEGMSVKKGRGAIHQVLTKKKVGKFETQPRKGEGNWCGARRGTNSSMGPELGAWDAGLREPI